MDCILGNLTPVLGMTLYLKLITGLAIGTFVSLLVYGMFSQRGRAEMTPQREVALATGHIDRDTVFESPLTQPLMWLLLLAARRINLLNIKGWTQRTLVAAGSPNFYTADEFIALGMLWALILMTVMEIANVVCLGNFSWAVVPIGIVMGMGGTLYYIHGKAVKRTKQISRRIPYTLDLIALAMGAGATFTEAVKTVVREDPDHPFNVELNTVLAEVDLGTTRAQSLRNLADRIPLESLRSIIASVIQAESLGTPLSEVLKGQANLLRLQRSVRAEKMAAAASVRILIPSVLILMSVVLAVFAPFIIKGVKGELFH